MQDQQKYVIIVAGGSGKRMGSELPKQFIVVAGKPILMHTIHCFHSYDSSMQIILVLPKDQHHYWNELISQYHFTVAHQVVSGGKERFNSVKNGLAVCGNTGLIGVHDGVRPLVNKGTISSCYESAAINKAVIPCIPANESIRKMENGNNHAVDRTHYFMVQTPQVFKAELLHQAYQQEFTPNFTDDASVVEAIGETITMVDGNTENIKITRPVDLKIAELLLS